MILIYSNLLLDDLCALDYLSLKYRQSEETFIIVGVDLEHTLRSKRSLKSIKSIKNFKDVVLSLLPNAKFYFQDEWVNFDHEFASKIYCMCPLTQLKVDFDKVVNSNTKIYFFAGTSLGNTGCQGEWNAEQDIDAYKFINRNQIAITTQFTSIELLQKFYLLEYQGYKSEYLNEYIDLCDQNHEIPVCYKFQFILGIETKQGLAIHAISNLDLLVCDFTNYYIGEISDLFKNKIYLEDMSTDVRNYIYFLFKEILADPVFNEFNDSEQLLTKIIAFFFCIISSLNKSDRYKYISKYMKIWYLNKYLGKCVWCINHINYFKDFVDYSSTKTPMTINYDNVANRISKNNKEDNSNELLSLYKISLLLYRVSLIIKLRYQKNNDSKIVQKINDDISNIIFYVNMYFNNLH